MEGGEVDEATNGREGVMGDVGIRVEEGVEVGGVEDVAWGEGSTKESSSKGGNDHLERMK